MYVGFSKTFFGSRVLGEWDVLLLLRRKTANIHHKSAFAQNIPFYREALQNLFYKNFLPQNVSISPTWVWGDKYPPKVRWPKTFPPSCFLQKSFTKSFHQKTDHIHNDNARGQIVSSVVLIEGTKKAIFLFPPSAEDCLSKTDIGTQQSCTATATPQKTILKLFQKQILVLSKVALLPRPKNC